MTKAEKLQAIREMLGSEANLLDAAYVLRELEERGIDGIDAVSDDEWDALIDSALRRGAREIREILSRHGDIQASVEDALANGLLLEAIEEWLRDIDHVAAYGTSETCLLGAGIDSLDDLEREAASRGPREAIEEFVAWWERAYAVYIKAREQDNPDDVCELLLTGNLEPARGLVQG